MRCNSNNRINTIYLGGGTPSQLNRTQLNKIISAIYIYNKVEDDAEITIEVNPDDVTESFVNNLSQLTINRVSMGVQTFSNDRLRFLHRRHSAKQVSEAVNRLRRANIQNISIDLMYGFPGETITDWETDIEAALALNVEHISAYCLMIEEGTPLYRMKPEPIDEELERQMYEILIDKLADAGYEHYEISNFAKPGMQSKHNSSYWNATPYIGIGAAAHSYDIQSRSWNVANIRQYIQGMERGKRLYEEEILDENTRYNDIVTVALRTREGIQLQNLQEKYRDYCVRNANKFIKVGLLQINQQHMTLTRKGLFVSDMIMSDLMWID